MSQPLTREPSKREQEEARDCALELTDALRSAPSVGVGLAGIELLVIHAFTQAIKPEYRLKSFDEFAMHARKQIEEAMRDAHH